MCMICNVPGEGQGGHPGQDFLDAFAASREAMSNAADAMAAVLRTDLDAAVRRRYDRTHKAMRRRIREWNALEELRETPVEDRTPA
jgi:aspartate carbamoyltransferase catalytic subunit